MAKNDNGMNIPFTRKEVSVHLLLWSLYFLFSIGNSYSQSEFYPFIILDLFPYLLLDALFFYACLYIALPEMNYKKLSAIGYHVIFMIFYICCYFLYSSYFYPKAYGGIFSDYRLEAIESALYSMVWIYLPSLGVYFYYKGIDNIKRSTHQEIMLAQKGELLARQELSILKSQFNSHLTFNTLNHIYAKVMDDDAIAQPILLLSDYLRYNLLKNPDQKVPLSSEIDQINNFIEIHNILTPGLQFRISVEGHGDDIYIPPRILVNFVENALKHGERNNPNFPLTLRLNVGDLLVFNLRNKKKQTPFPQSGIGSEITKKALDIFYPGQYELTITEDDTFYEVNLTINMVYFRKENDTSWQNQQEINNPSFAG